jgi:hypothetical protein
MRGKAAERLAGVLAQCPELAHLDLRQSFAGKLGQCAALAHLKLSYNRIEVKITAADKRREKEITRETAESATEEAAVDAGVRRREQERKQGGTTHR